MYVILLLVLLSSIVLYFFTQKYFISKKIYDKIKFRSSHSVLATRSGGSSIFIIFLITTIYLYITSNEIYDFSIFIPLGILYTVGLYDDFYQVDFKLKFVFQLIVGKILIDQGVFIESFNGLMGIYEIPYMISQILSIILIVFIINATNFSDGIDGLAITEVIKCLFILIAFNSWDFYYGYTFLFTLILVSLLPLYYYNFKKKNKVFLGDSGSLLLGGVVCICIISLINLIGSIKDISIVTPLIILLCFPYPIIDSTYVIIKRIINKKSPFIADKSHIHHLILKKGFSQRQCLMIISGSTGIIQLATLIYITYSP